MDFLSPWALVGLALVPAIFLWGLLAPRGRRVTVGSLVLWRQALGSGPAGRPSARLRLRDPLLWLDAGAVLLLVLACARPAVRTSSPSEPVASLVIDRTAAMMVEPKGGQGPRYLQVRAAAKRLFDATGNVPIDVVSVPGPAGEVTVESLPAGEALAADHLWTPLLVERFIWREALAEAARRPDRPVILATDVAPPEGLTLPGNFYVLAAGGESPNVGLTRVAARIEGDRAWLLVAARAAPAALGPHRWLYVTDDGRELFHREDFLAPGQTAEVVVPLPPGPLPERLSVNLDTPGHVAGLLPEGFRWDDSAYLVLDRVPQRTILLVGSADPALRQALAVQPNTRVLDAPADTAAPLDGVDLVIACGAPLPADWKGPAAVVAPAEAVGPVRPLEGEAPAAWQVQAAHPLAGALYLEPPQIGPVRRYELSRGADLLLGTADVPLAATWQSDGARRLAVLFPFDKKTTDWSHRPGFPVFWLHAVEWLAPAAGGTPGYATYRPFAAVPGRAERAPARPGFYDDQHLAVSFIGAEGPFASGPARDDGPQAIEAIRASVAAHRALAHTDLWPLLALGVLAVLIARARVGR